MRRKHLTACCLALLMGVSLAGCPRGGLFASCASDEVPTASGSGWICMDGRKRTFEVHVPDALDGTAPLVVLLHGGGGDAENMRRKTGFDAHADAQGLVVVYPDGTPASRGAHMRTWNAMHCCGRAFEEGTDDVAFLERLIEVMVATGHADADRVIVGGHSNGAMMAYRFAAERSGMVAGVAAVAGSIGGQAAPGLLEVRIPSPREPVDVLIMHARDDTHVPYGGGTGPDTVGGRVDLSVEQAVAFWVEADQATDEPAFSTYDGVGWRHHKGGRDGTQVALVTTEGGHGWPGGLPTVTGRPSAPDASEVLAGWSAAR